MDAHQLIAELRAQGVSITPDPSGNLSVRSRERLTDAQRTTIRTHKTVLLAYFQHQPDAGPPPLTAAQHQAVEESVEERAAVREFDGGQPPAAAEAAARAPMRVFHYRLAEKPNSWLVLICPGCTPDEARAVLHQRFGKNRLIDLLPHTERDRRHGFL